ncbi:nucleoporin Nup188 [Anthonomus grandis grandis]|uniref:nucleoporin Nup188 n=1 Tax=Anthonomus grandis grandis TaxID=2921223 RepID=UPI00216681AE|nr:nucleoporin Nup188 [Anthonomus grandis grandis]XP_050313936.1 nucleoporin Nup188 [Anthonomus grandis grandis]
MSKETEDTLPVWHKIYEVISGSNKNVIPQIVEEALEICKHNLAKVLLNYDMYTKESFREWQKTSESMLLAQDDEISNFIHRVSKELDLDSTLAWSIICNFLLYEYMGKVDDLKSIIRYEANIKSIISQLWQFYTTDRMFMLKSLRFLFEKSLDENFMYIENVKSFFRAISIKEMWENSKKSFQILKTEVSTDKITRIDEDAVPLWVQRNNREQIEVLLIMVHLCEVMELSGDELVDVLKLFMVDGFGRHPFFLGATSLSRSEDLVDIRNAEIGVVITLVKRFWQDPETFNMLPNNVEKSMKDHQLQGDNSSILFIWNVFKCTLDPDEHADECNDLLRVLIDKKVFVYLAEFLASNLFKDNRLEEVVFRASHIMFIEFTDIVHDYRFIYEQDGFIKVLCELYKKPYLNALTYLGKYFEIGLDMFPFMLDHFLCMVEAALESNEYYSKLMKLLQNCPTYCTELAWPYSSDAFKMTEEKPLFAGSQRFIIPIGTLAEKCSCFGFDALKYHYKFNFFELVDQLIKSLTMWAYRKGDFNKLIFDYVIRANKFLTHIVRNYKGNFREDTTIRPLLQRLDCVPTYYNKGAFRNYEFFKVYFEAKCAMIKCHNIEMNEAFPPEIRKFLFPFVVDYKDVEKLNLLQTNSDCILYGFLNEEQVMSDHSLALEYVEFIFDILRKNKPHEDIVYSGVWYILTNIFPCIKKWLFEDAEPFQQLRIVNGCLRVFIHVLNKHSDNQITTEQKELLTLVHDSFLNMPNIINSFYNIFVKDKFYLPTVMHQESNWLNGKSLVVLDTVRLELLTLLLVFKCRTQILNLKFPIDEKIHFIAMAASRYFINPYNSTLAVLAGRFLEILAKNENIPLLSCLGLDYDQVQILFLERLRDPMEDEQVKLNILNIINTCINHQTGMTAAFFNIQASKKWYNPHVKKIDGDTVGDFMMDYLKNIKKSLIFLKCPLQVGILQIMASLWQNQKQHLIKHITSEKDFWSLLVDPLFKPFEQAPVIYSYLIKILSIQLMMSLKKPNEDDEKFYKALEGFLCSSKQLKLFQEYLLKIFLNKNLKEEQLKDRESLLYAWSELLATVNKQDKIKYFTDEQSKYAFLKLAFLNLENPVVHKNIFHSWLQYIIVAVDMFRLDFKDHHKELAEKAIIFTRIVGKKYNTLPLADKSAFYTVVLRIIQDLKPFYEKFPHELLHFLDSIGSMVDTEHTILEDQVWEKFKKGDIEAKEWLAPWVMIILIANHLLSLKNCEEFKLWFAYRKYLQKITACTSELLSFKQKETLQAGKMALYSLTLYVKSPLAYDFLELRLPHFFDRVEPIIKDLLFGQVGKDMYQTNVIDIKEGWMFFNLLLKFMHAYIQKFQKLALDTCYSFLMLNEQIMRHALNLPESTVDLAALDLLTEVLLFYIEVVENWKTEWHRKQSHTFTFMIDGIRKTINSCIYICLRPKHIVFYYLDDYYRLNILDEDAECVNELMICIINRLINILGLGFECLYKLNANVLDLLDVHMPDESPIILIENDFNVPKFELPIPCELTYGKLLCLSHFLCKTIGQLHAKRHEIDRENNKSGKNPKLEFDENTYITYIGLVEHQNPSEFLPDQKLSSFLRYLYEYSGLIDPWINNLNIQNVRRTADQLMLFIGQQAFLTIKILDPNELTSFKRTLYGELQFFQEYVKKQTSELLMEEKPATSPSVISIEMDCARRYLTFKKQQKAYDKVVEENFLLMTAMWFSNICQLQ